MSDQENNIQIAVIGNPYIPPAFVAEAIARRNAEFVLQPHAIEEDKIPDVKLMQYSRKFYTYNQSPQNNRKENQAKAAQNRKAKRRRKSR